MFGQHKSNKNTLLFPIFFLQEPVLFSCSISENIAYGAEDPSSVTQEEIRRVADIANALSFVENFPKGFDTVVGEKGVLLSGRFVTSFVKRPCHNKTPSNCLQTHSSIFGCQLSALYCLTGFLCSEMR